MILYIVRHAWAGEHGDPTYPDDSLRPLTSDGRKRFAEMLRRLPAKCLEPSVIVTSPLVRCRQTAEILADHLADHPDVVEHDALQPGSDLDTLLAWTKKHAGGDAAWVGHAPDVSDLTAALIGGHSAAVRFSKGSLAAIRFDEELARGGGELCWLVTAKVLGC